ncbi:MAG: hypothetical protein ACRDRL_01805 [Sciscionella sp.]
MSAPPFELVYTVQADKILTNLERKQYQQKRKKVLRTLKQLQVYGPRHPGLHSHPYKSVQGPGGAAPWESYVESRTPGAWRIWWIYGPDTGQITIVLIGPHPD